MSFHKFIDGIMDKQKSYAAFMTLFWTGMRLGEMLALTPADIDFEDKTIRINKTYNTKEKKNGRYKTHMPAQEQYQFPIFYLLILKTI